MLRKRPVPDRPCVLITSLVRPRGFPSAPWEHCLRCAMCLLWGADLRLWHSWQMSTVQDPRKTWLATGGLLTVWWKMLSLGPRLQQPSSSGSGFHKPPSLPPAGEGPICSQLALFWYSLNPLFCEHARVCVRAFVAKFFFFFSLAIPWFGLLAHVSSLGSSSGNSGPVLTLRSDDATPASLVGDLSLWATSPLAIAVRNVFCGGFFFFSWLCCPLRFQNSPQTRRRVSYCGNFSSFTTSSPGCWLLFLSFFFFFSILSYLLLKRMGCLSECLVSSASIVLWKLFNIQMSFWWICGRESGLLSYSFAILGPPRGIFHGPTDLCVCCNIQQENRKLKTLKFKLHGYRICNVNLIILKFFLKLDQNHLGLLKQIAFYVSISDLVCLGWVLKFAFLTSSR